MNLHFLKSPRKNSNQKTLEVLVERIENGGFSATVIGLPNHTKFALVRKIYGLQRSHSQFMLLWSRAIDKILLKCLI